MLSLQYSCLELCRSGSTVYNPCRFFQMFSYFRREKIKKEGKSGSPGRCLSLQMQPLVWDTGHSSSSVCCVSIPCSFVRGCSPPWGPGSPSLHLQSGTDTVWGRTWGCRGWAKRGQTSPGPGPAASSGPDARRGSWLPQEQFSQCFNISQNTGNKRNFNGV